MIPSFTIAPTDFAATAEAVLAAAATDRAITIERRGGVTTLFFGGVPAVAAVAKGRGLACMRLLADAGVMHVELEGYQGSMEQAEQFLTWVLYVLAPGPAFADETGAELSPLVQASPFEIYGPEPTFREDT